jgi:hypothetical protein
MSYQDLDRLFPLIQKELKCLLDLGERKSMGDEGLEADAAR